MQKTPVKYKIAILSLGFFYLIILMGMIRSNAVVAQTWKTEWEKTLAAAKNEGKLVLYIGGGYDAALSAFRKRYPEIKVTTVTGRGSGRSRLPHYRSTCIDGHEAHLQTREQNPSPARKKIRRSSWPTKDQTLPEESLLMIV